MGIFTNSFFSIAGQKERLSNVASVLKSAVTLKGDIKSNISNPVANTVVTAAVNNPYTTALVGATAASSLGRTAVTKAVTGLSTKTKVIGGAVALTTLPAVVSSPVLTTAAIKTASVFTPENLIKSSLNIGKSVNSPNKTTITDAIKSSGPIAAVLGASAIAVGGVAVASAYSNLKSSSSLQNAADNLNKTRSDTISIMPIPAATGISGTSQPVNINQYFSTPTTSTPLGVGSAVTSPVAALNPVKQPAKKKKKAAKKKKKAKPKKKKAPKKKKKTKSLKRKKKKKR